MIVFCVVSAQSRKIDSRRRKVGTTKLVVNFDLRSSLVRTSQKSSTVMKEENLPNIHNWVTSLAPTKNFKPGILRYYRPLLNKLVELFERVTKQQEGRWAAFVFPSEIRLFSILRAPPLFVSCALCARESCLSHPNNASIMKLSHYATRLSVANNSLLSSWNWLLSIIAGDSQRFAKRSRQYRTWRKFSFFSPLSISHSANCKDNDHSLTSYVWSNAKAHQTILSVTREDGRSPRVALKNSLMTFHSLLFYCSVPMSSSENPWLTLNLFLNLFLTN